MKRIWKKISAWFQHQNIIHSLKNSYSNFKNITDQLEIHTLNQKQIRKKEILQQIVGQESENSKTRSVEEGLFCTVDEVMDAMWSGPEPPADDWQAGAPDRRARTARGESAASPGREVLLPPPRIWADGEGRTGCRYADLANGHHGCSFKRCVAARRSAASNEGNENEWLSQAVGW
jgi:hypothetical protein